MFVFLKRLFDIVFSLIMIIITLPLLVIVLLITFIDTGLPLMDIRFKRIGKNKKNFYMYKVRTRYYKKGEKYYTKIGKFFDKTGLNELPQFYNVLIGNMSVIGPRAFIYGEKLPDLKISEKRYKVKPGILGLAQSLGGRNLSYKKTLECDIIYYDNYGFKQDLIILIRGFKELVKRIIRR